MLTPKTTRNGPTPYKPQQPNCTQPSSQANKPNLYIYYKVFPPYHSTLHTLSQHVVDIVFISPVVTGNDSSQSLNLPLLILVG